MPDSRSNMTRKQRTQEETELMASRKREERAKREAYKKERKIESYLADDENFPCFATQLEKLGLQLRDIPGDGNCLLRALGDQLEGHCRNHYRHRQDVVRYMINHRTDFEPFIEDDIPFETHIHNLSKLGVYAGNDAIVAFARLHQVNVIIHQLNAKHLMITGSPSSTARQLHISYHNGDHYSSVRKLHDNTESPANVRIQEKCETPGVAVHSEKIKGGGSVYVRAVRGCQVIEEEVIAATKCTDMKLIRETLTDCDYNADAAIAHLLQMMELSQPQDEPAGAEDTTPVLSHVTTTTDSGMWSDSSTGLRVFGISNKNKSPHVHFRDDSIGGSSGYGSMNSNHGGARPKLTNIAALQYQQQAPGSGVGTSRLSSRKQKEAKKLEKKQRAEERHRQRILASKVPADVSPAPSQLFIAQPAKSSSFTVI